MTAGNSEQYAVDLRQLIMGFRITQMVYVAAKLGLADALQQHPQSATALAGAVGTAPQPLYRLMRALASIGIFSEDAEGTFSLTPTAELLRSDAPGSLRTTALLYGDPVFWSAYGQMLHSVRTGSPAFDQCHGEPLFSYLDNHPETSLLFHALMSDSSEREMASILEAYDYSGFLSVVDVGGGNGALVSALLKEHPALHGTIVDLDAAAKGARLRLAKAGLERRGLFHPGSFFQDIPPGADLYILKSVLHNWKEPAARRILHNCRRAMRPDSRLLLIERVIAERNLPSEAKLFDINMLVVTGGEERTEASYRELLEAADLKLLRVLPTRSPLSLLEAARGCE